MACGPYVARVGGVKLPESVSAAVVLGRGAYVAAGRPWWQRTKTPRQGFIVAGGWVVVGFVELAAGLTSGGQVWYLALIASFFLVLAAAYGRTGRSPTRWPGRTRRTGWSCRYGRSHGSSGPGSWGAWARSRRSGPAPGSATSRPRTGPVRSPAHVQADDIADLVDELRVSGQLPARCRWWFWISDVDVASQSRASSRSAARGLTWNAPDNAPGYQDAIDHRVTTIHPGGCAPARRKHSVDVITQTCIRRRTRQDYPVFPFLAARHITHTERGIGHGQYPRSHCRGRQAL